ncbi:MarR family winged helix-turn-helix transcriptional regulator [Actinocrispum sp. NPDC049592]|uniref:MarR family winged helix-turn-helix transcriptional regulator n=1 Tax=Actinocrispum sp. NPDC049592 TaxID=3154835 RepID=UPI003412C45B
MLEPDEWEFWATWMRAQQLLAQELDRGLQRDCAISKAEFSVLMTLYRAQGDDMRVSDLVDALDWEKSRVSHQLTRMENRGLVTQTESGASGRRTRVGLTTEGRTVAQSAILVHGANIRRHFLDPLTPDQAATIRAWSEQLVGRLEPRHDT